MDSQVEPVQKSTRQEALARKMVHPLTTRKEALATRQKAHPLVARQKAYLLTMRREARLLATRWEVPLPQESAERRPRRVLGHPAENPSLGAVGQWRQRSERVLRNPATHHATILEVCWCACR